MEEEGKFMFVVCVEQDYEECRDLIETQFVDLDILRVKNPIMASVIDRALKNKRKETNLSDKERKEFSNGFHKSVCVKLPAQIEAKINIWI
jgi:hypothetical protein